MYRYRIAKLVMGNTGNDIMETFESSSLFSDLVESVRIHSRRRRANLARSEGAFSASKMVMLPTMTERGSIAPSFLL